MNERDFLQLGIYLLLLIALTPPLGRFMMRVFTGGRTLLSPALGPVERAIYVVGGVDPAREMSWLSYAGALLVFNVLGCALTMVGSSRVDLQACKLEYSIVSPK